MLPIITEIRDRNHFLELLYSNPGVFIIKFGADWCAPCKLIEEDVKKFMNIMPETVQCAIINVDECVDVYSYLKNKRMINGIPAIMVYHKGNVKQFPDDMVVGADITKIAALFNRAYKKSV